MGDNVSMKSKDIGFAVEMTGMTTDPVEALVGWGMSERDARIRAAVDSAIRELGSLGDETDQEACHLKADAILLEVLRALGHGNVADAFEAARKRIDFLYH